MADNYYKILGVEKNAAQDDIKSAYRKLAKQYHPDVNPGDKNAEAKFKEVNEAYDTLSNDQKRAAYDYQQEHPGMGGGFSSGFSGGGSGSIFEDLFGDFFGGFSNKREAAEPGRGNDVQVNMNLTFLEAAKGCKKDVTYTKNEKCGSCNGIGAKDGKEYEKCKRCNGTGKIQHINEMGFIRTVNTRVCNECGGSGKKILTKCGDCGGRGYNRKTVTVNLEIPAGVDQGNVLFKRGFGDAQANGSGAPGDLLLVINVSPHRFFTRKGLNLYVDVPISYAIAVNGGKVYVPAIDEAINYNIPECTPGGKVFMVKGRGIKTKNGQTGDLYLNIIIEIPKSLNREQRALLEKLNSITEDKQYTRIKTYKDNMRELYGKDAGNK